MPLDSSERLNITILYDNNPYDERLKTAWGFSCLVERGDLTLLFDTGGEAPTLLSSMATIPGPNTRWNRCLRRLAENHTNERRF